MLGPLLLHLFLLHSHDLRAARMSDEDWVCICGRAFRSEMAMIGHTRRCTGVPLSDDAGAEHEGTAPSEASQPAAAAEPIGAAPADAEEEHARSLFEASFKGLTGLRVLYNASNAQVQAVRDFFSELLVPMRAELTRRVGALIPADESTPLPDLSALVGSVTDVFRGLHSAYMEKKARAAKLPNLMPVRRVLGTRSESTDLPDGRMHVTQIEDVVYDYDVVKHLDALHEHYPDLCADFLESSDRWRWSRDAGEISDTCHGQTCRRHPLKKLAVQHGLFPLLLHYYMDGIGLTNPLALPANSRKVAVSYVVVLNYSPTHRTSSYCIIPVSLCYEKDWSRYNEADVVGGRADEPADGTSFGAQMRRLGDPACRTQLRVPARFASHPCVETITHPGGIQTHHVCCCGGVVLVSADSPAAGQIFGTKISFGPSTVCICRLCYCKQIDGANRRAHCVPNSFLPWTAGQGSSDENGSGLFDGLVCTDASLTSMYDPNFMGAKQVHKLRTVESVTHSMRVAQLLDDGGERDHYLQSIGVRDFSHAFSRVPFSLYVDSVMDLMHVETLELITHHLSKMVWKFNRELGWIQSVGHWNIRMRSFEHWCKGSRRSVYLLSDTAFQGDLQSCSIGGLWTAHYSMIFMLYSVELLSYFVPDDQKDHPVWRCWCLHHKYFLILLQRSFTLTDIRTLDQTIYTMQSMFLQIYGEECWLPKFHFAQHFPVSPCVPTRITPILLTN